MSMSPIKPYLNAIIGVVLVALLISVFAYGRSTGRKAQSADDKVQLDKMTEAYDIARAGLANAGVALREVSAKAHEEAAKAKQQQAQGAVAVTEAKQATQDMRGRVSKLEHDLKHERSTCTEAEARICGIELR